MNRKYFGLLLILVALMFVACTGGVGEVPEAEEEAPAEVEEQEEAPAEEEEMEEEEAMEEEEEMAEEAMDGLEEITVAYFLEWPTPNQFAQLEELYDEALGLKVNWVSFDTGVAMSAAMASGDVQIAYSQGLVPFANAVSAGVDLQMVGIAVSYAENDNCVARADLGISRDNVTDLHGQQVAVPIGTVAHYKMLKEMEYLGVDVAQLELVDLAPADGAAALQRGDVAMACGWGGGLARMKEAGNIIMTGAEMEEEIGLKVFDVVSTTGDFAANHGDIITAFLQVTEDANAQFAKDPESMMATIAEAAGMDDEGTRSNLATFSFPTADEQLSAAWMGGTVQTFVKEVADFFVEQGELEAAQDDYGQFIDTSFLEGVDSAEAMMMDDGDMMEAMERPEEITVAYFLEWPTPNQFAQIEELYDDALGMTVNWVSFDTGVAMSAAMASGDVQIAYSQGLVPFANAVSAGLDLQMVGIAVSYAENDNCVARADLGLNRDNITELEGQPVAVPIGTVAHYKMLKELQYLGVDTDALELVDLAPADGAAALQRGDVAMACGWGGGLARMKEAGNIIMTGAEMEEEIGLKVFDVVSVTGEFAKNHPDVIVDFLQVTEDANAQWAKDPGSMIDQIAVAAGMEVDGAQSNLDTFVFPTADEQLSDAWMGSTVENFVTEVANFFVEQGELEAALDNYGAVINTSMLEQVSSAPAMMSDSGGDMEMAEEACEVDLSGETITLYQQAGREGPLAALLGQGFAFATEDAVGWINGEGGGICGADVEVVFTETNYDTEKEVAAFESAVAADPRPFVVFTYASGATVALKDRVVEEQIVNLAAGLNGPAMYDPANGYTVGFAPIYSDQFAGYAEYLVNNWDDLKPEGAGDSPVIGVIGWANSFGAGATTDEAVAYVESLGATVLPLEEIALSPDADASGPVQNLLLGGANVIWNQSLSFTVAQVIGTVHALGVWDSVIVSGVNWSMHNDVPAFMGDNQALMDGYCGPHPYATWNDTDVPGVALATELFEAAGRPAEDKSTTYLTTFGQFMGVREILIHTVNETGSADISGEQFLNAMIDLGTVTGMGIAPVDLSETQRASRTLQVGCWSANGDGSLSFDIVSDTFEAPDTAPYPEG
ncbi:MAG: ABC transporter substrate-binding protein [Chloroflexota bacterium]